MKGRNDARLTGQAYSQLKAAIFEGRLPPGTPLSRRRLAEELGMSAVPVGDAILRLESEGLIESRPRAGTRVRIATPQEIHGNYVLREALETHSARLFAENADGRARERLLKAAERLDAANLALARGKCSQFRRARVERIHVAFHMLIAAASGVPALIDAIERSRVLLFNRLFTGSLAASHLPERWHRDLAECLVSASPEAAAEAMRTHVRYRQQEVIARFKELVEARSGPARMVRGPQRRTLEENGGAGALLD
ncbi:MAG: GntR family transcriptional regulator [Acidobacteria bacterium]|nr:GntR family transcriptional regulator [Acidobacteriota bacterium]MBI3472146.1 GntR family transcriptional regulator [Candidatus Solibacter usitatus]